jgi:predicted ribosome quality control (RQC) complex YloA/Tae2 family protein
MEKKEEDDREYLFGDSGRNPWENHKDRIKDSLEKSSNSIDNSLRVGIETEKIAENIIGNLDKQKGQLLNAEQGVCF